MSEPKSEAEKAAEMGRSAAEYCKNIRTEIPNIEEASADSIVWNLRFMAYCAGYRAGSASAAPTWISVEERLPTKDKRGVPADSILAYGVNPERYQTWKDKFGKALEHKERYIACFVPEYGFLKNGYYFRTETEKALVTHWMPLPAAPEVEK